MSLQRQHSKNFTDKICTHIVQFVVKFVLQSMISSYFSAHNIRIFLTDQIISVLQISSTLSTDTR